VSKVTDPDLMMLADGELDAAEASALERAAGANGALKVAAVREVGDLVRGHLELAADDAEDRLNGLWDLVERRLDVQDELEVAATKPRSKRDATPASPGVWSRVVKWFDGHRAHVLTGVLSAGAVAALTFVLREDPRVEYRDRIINAPVANVQPDAGTNPMVLVATPPEVESLEVNGGTGTVFTIENDDGETETAVIWVTPDDVLEGI
jgi:anti-sigma factor RsiW